MKHPVDAHVGKRIKYRRRYVGMTQEQVANKVGVTFQQIQKYETGMNRVSASRLWDMADAMGVKIGFFFEGLRDDAEQPDDKDFMSDKEAIDLVQSYYAIPEPKRRRLLDLAKVLADPC